MMILVLADIKKLFLTFQLPRVRPRHEPTTATSGTMMEGGMQLLNRDGHSISHNSKRHYHDSFVSMNRMRQRGLLCDIVLHVSNKEIKAHKVVLASCSPYFHAMFTSKFSLLWTLMMHILYTVPEVNKDEQVAWQTQTANYFSLLFEFVHIRTCFCVGACRYGCPILSASSLPSTYSCLGHRWSCEVCVSQISSQTLALCEDAVCLQTVICLETQLLDFMSSDRVPN